MPFACLHGSSALQYSSQTPGVVPTDCLSVHCLSHDLNHRLSVTQLEAALESHQRMVSDKLSVGELMTTQMTALEPVMLVSKLEGVLRRCAHQAFPITTEVDKAFAASKTPTCDFPRCCHRIAWQHVMR